MPESLVTCPVCLTPNFTPRGLKAHKHKCKGGTRLNRQTGLVEVIELPAALLSPCIDVSEIQIADTSSSSSSLLSSVLQSSVSPVADINAFHRRATASAAQARESAADACHYAVLCGVRLKALREETPHGEWGKFFTSASRRLTTNVSQIGKCDTFDVSQDAFEFSSETAQRYMEVAKRIQSAKRLSGTAVRRLGVIAQAAEVDEAARKWLNKLTEGQNLRQLYLDLEIIGSKDKAQGPPAAPAPARVVKSEAKLRMEDAREACFVWRENWTKLVKRGHLDDLPQPELRELHEFLATCRDATKARLAPAAKSKP